jgi:hypothetical protein
MQRKNVLTLYEKIKRITMLLNENHNSKCDNGNRIQLFSFD